MTRPSSIQEGGCTSGPRFPLPKLGELAVLPMVAILSPFAVAGVACALAKLTGPGVNSISVVLRAAIAGVAVAVALSVAAFWRATDRESRILSAVGLVGNLLVLTGGIAYAALR